MTAMAVAVNEMLDTLDVDDYNAALRYIEFLSVSRKREKSKASKNALSEIQQMFQDDQRWDSEDEMLAEMAEFRRERMKL